MKTCEGTFLEQRQYTKTSKRKTLNIHTLVASQKKTMCVPVISLISTGKTTASVDVSGESVSRGHGGCLVSCASSGSGSRTRVARIGNRNPKEHFMIVTGTIGYVIVVVESIGHAVVLSCWFNSVGRILVVMQGESDGAILWRFVVVIHTCGQ